MELILISKYIIKYQNTVCQFYIIVIDFNISDICCICIECTDFINEYSGTKSVSGLFCIGNKNVIDTQ